MYSPLRLVIFACDRRVSPSPGQGNLEQAYDRGDASLADVDIYLGQLE